MKRLIIIMSVLGCIMVSCGGDEPSPSSAPSSNSKKEVIPSIAKVSSTTTTSDFTVTFRVKSVDLPSVRMEYSRESKKTSNPSLNKKSTPKCISIEETKSSGYSWYYYKTSHTGFRGGDYIYYQITASNDRGSDKSSVDYCIIRR